MSDSPIFGTQQHFTPLTCRSCFGEQMIEDMAVIARGSGACGGPYRQRTAQDFRDEDRREALRTSIVMPRPGCAGCGGTGIQSSEEAK